jgi:hypothetical protein
VDILRPDSAYEATRIRTSHTSAHFHADRPNDRIFGATAQFAAPAITAVVVGLAFAGCANNDVFHTLARRMRLTKETSYPSQWFSALTKNVTYVVLQLTDERRLYGWPTEWPSDPREGQFVLQQASWLTKDGEVPISGVASVMLDVRDVKWVEFMEKTWEDKK